MVIYLMIVVGTPISVRKFPDEDKGVEKSFVSYGE